MNETDAMVDGVVNRTILAATIVVAGFVGTGCYVMSHGYRITFGFELAPASAEGSKQSTR